MTTAELDKLLKRANKVLDTYEGKINALQYDYFIISNIIFTSDTNYYYLFSVYKDNKPIEKVATYTNNDYIRIFKELTTKYNTNVIYNYKDLNTKQLKYLEDQDDNNLNKDEISSLLFQDQFNIF